MSVDMQQQTHENGNFSVTSKARIESRPLNLTQFPKRHGRKRSTPQKAIKTEDVFSDPESPTEGSFENDDVMDESAGSNMSEELDKTKSILEHYRAFMQRNLSESNGSVDRKPPKKARLMKTTSLGCDRTDDFGWGNAQSYQNGDDLTMFEPIVNGPVNGPNGLIPERTMRQNNWAIKVWRDWALTRNRKPETKLERFSEAPVDIRVADIEVMSYWLPRFIKEVRRKDKKPYPADTLMQIASGLQRYLRQVSCRSEVNFFDKYSSTFAEFRDALKSRSGELSVEAQASKAGKRVQVDNLNDDELWQTGYLDYTTAKGIFHVMFYYNCVEFEITSMEEHHELKVEQFSVSVDKTKNQDYLEFKRSDQRYYNMSTKQIMRRYSTKNDPRCLVKLYKAYLDLVPSTGPFYRRPLQTPENSSPRFSFNPVGINKLRETYKQLFTPDRPASLRRSGKTTTIRHMSHHSSDNTSPAPVTPTTNSASLAVYDEITQKLKSSGHLRQSSPAENNTNVVDLSVKMNDSFDSEQEEEDAIPLSAEDVMERIRRSWHTAREEQRRDSEESAHDSDNDDVLSIKVPRYVKRVVIERDGKKFKFDLN
ncbi:uncharacterized protein LOC143461253 isoform X2 [Clavelina lepadiformis]|uniref:uncharacterized protein LOC143461253 isoform X2 n=1 Tax=Clavelina lepadiformis TaxID=159417 RepID=UPI0040421235